MGFKEAWFGSYPDAKPYEELRSGASDNEYLYLINHKLGCANMRLNHIYNALLWIAACAAIATLKYVGVF